MVIAPDELRAKAEASHSHKGDGWYQFAHALEAPHAARDDDSRDGPEEHDAAFIAATSPARIITLLDERDALLAEVARLKAEREATRQALMAYTEQHGWEHDIYVSGDDEVDCPEDDTCDCPYFPALNAAMLPPPGAAK